MCISWKALSLPYILHAVKFMILWFQKSRSARPYCYQSYRYRVSPTSTVSTKGRSILFNYFIDMRTIVRLSISCRKNVFLLKFSNKNTFFPNEMDKLTVVLMSIKRLNKERRPLRFCQIVVTWDLLYDCNIWKHNQTRNSPGNYMTQKNSLYDLRSYT